MISGQKPYAWSAAAGSISAQTAGVDAANNAYAAGNFAFLGLPTSYNGSTGDPNSFGNHLSILKVDGNNSETAHIQTFFRGTASNWPGTDGITPNWYHYYSQYFTSPGFYDPNATSSYTDSQSPPQYPIHISNDAHGPYSVRVFDINPTPPNYVRYVGYLDLAGIDHYIYTCAHETGHQVIFLGGGIYNFNADPAHTSPISADGDNVSDAWEPNHHLNPNSSDTANAYGIQGNGDQGDTEVLADVQALPVLFQQISAWKQDWADDGLQWGPNAYTTGNPPGFYFTFHALVSGTTVVAGNTYSIRSLNDLQTQYSSLLTRLP